LMIWLIKFRPCPEYMIVPRVLEILMQGIGYNVMYAAPREPGHARRPAGA